MKSAWFLALSSIMLLSAAKAAEPSRQENSARIHTELAAEYYARAQYGVALEEIKAARDAVPDYAPTFNVEGLV
uniref:hypothetical protein n=1 Tax=Chitinimonas sp. TaxID=1934313 RepID=UPI0035B48375